MQKDSIIGDSEGREQWDVSAVPNVPGLILPTLKSKRQAEEVLMTVSAIETTRNRGVKKTMDRMRHYFTSFFVYLDQEFQLEIYYGGMVSRSM